MPPRRRNRDDGNSRGNNPKSLPNISLTKVKSQILVQTFSQLPVSLGAPRCLKKNGCPKRVMIQGIGLLTSKCGHHVGGQKGSKTLINTHMGMGQNHVALVNIKIGGKMDVHQLINVNKLYL